MPIGVQSTSDPVTSRRRHGVAAIVSLATAVPQHTSSQNEVKDRLLSLFDLSPRRRDAASGLFDNSAVERRYSVESLDELGKPKAVGDMQRRYREHAIVLGRQVAQQALATAGLNARDIDLIVTVSCTGIMIPSLDAYLINELGFRRDVRRLPITELGCFGGAAALARTHDLLAGFPDWRALVVAVELPSLSLQRADFSPANLISTALFGDGAAAVVMEGARKSASGSGDSRAAGRRVRIVDTLSHIIPNSTDALGFDLHDDGFHCVLSKDVPALLKNEVPDLIDTLTARNGLSREDLSSFVLHPGGRRILEFLGEALGLAENDLGPSWHVLRNYGNQSSASVLFVLNEWMRAQGRDTGRFGVLAAFGPGLSAELLLLEWDESPGPAPWPTL